MAELLVERGDPKHWAEGQCPDVAQQMCDKDINSHHFHMIGKKNHLSTQFRTGVYIAIVRISLH